jgi:hypothetical protein
MPGIAPLAPVPGLPWRGESIECTGRTALLLGMFPGKVCGSLGLFLHLCSRQAATAEGAGRQVGRYQHCRTVDKITRDQMEKVDVRVVVLHQFSEVS